MTLKINTNKIGKHCLRLNTARGYRADKNAQKTHVTLTLNL